MTDELFERFWLAGMRKCNKKKARPLFNRVLKGHADPESFVTMLIIDIKARLDSNQLGFVEMHPTTYLNGERWEDEIVEARVELTKAPLMERLTDRSWADHMMKPDSKLIN